MVAPCKDCAERKLYCHSSCERYIAFQQYREQELQRARDARATQQYFYDSAMRNKYGHKRQHGQDIHKEKHL